MRAPEESNRKRALEEVVSLEAWHKRFTIKRKRSPLHVDVVFKEGFIGAEANAPVRFRLSLRRAEITVVIPPGEPARVAPESVSRDAPAIQSKAILERRAKTMRTRRTSAQAAADLTKVAPSAKLQLGDESSRGVRAAIVSVQKADGMTVLHSVNPDGNHQWEIRPAGTEAIAGRPWNAKKRPRLTLIDTRASRARGIAAAVRIEIRCRRQDLKIDDIVVKDEALLEKLKHATGFRNRMAAAEAAIRARLTEAGLFSGEIADPFVTITIEAVASEEIGDD